MGTHQARECRFTRRLLLQLRQASPMAHLDPLGKADRMGRLGLGKSQHT